MSLLIYGAVFWIIAIVSSILQDRFPDVRVSQHNSWFSLKQLIARSNSFKEFKLDPFVSYSEDSEGNEFCRLTDVSLDYNQLEEIDLQPLSMCRNLQSLNIAVNKLRNIDLYPLSSCRKITRFLFYGNSLQDMDITPLVLNLPKYYFKLRKTWSLRWILETVRNLDGGARLTEVPLKTIEPIQKMVSSSKSMRTINLILDSLDLRSLGFLDEDISDQILTIPSITPIEIARETIEPFVLDALCNQIDKGGTTIGLDIEGVMHHAGLVSRVTRIIELRESEMKRVRVPVFKRNIFNIHNLRALWLTAYGHQVLSALKMPLEIREEGFEIVTEAFEKLGYNIRTTNRRKISKPVNISSDLKQYIWSLIPRHQL